MKFLYLYPSELGKEEIPPFEFMNVSLDNSIEYKLFDENTTPDLFSNLEDNVRNFNPDLIFFLGRSIKSYRKIKNYSLKLQELNLPIFLLGDLSTAYEPVLKNTGVDFVIKKGFERSFFKQIVKSNSKSLKGLDNIIFLEENNIFFNPLKDLIGNTLDETDFPNYNLIDFDYYAKERNINLGGEQILAKPF